MGIKAGDSLAFVPGRNGMRIVPKRANENIFEKYRGTVDFGIKGGRNGIIKFVRDMRDGK